MPRRALQPGLTAAVLATALAAVAADDVTIGALLRAAEISPRPALPRNLRDEKVSNGADLSTDRDFIYAGWSMLAGRFDTLHVLAIDRRNGAWKHRAYKGGGPGGDASLIGGSILDVRASQAFVALDIHQSPSAGTTWVLRRDLSRAGAFYGWIKAWLPNDLMVYERSQIHFGPTHSLEISIYDPATSQSTPIYPIVESLARQTFVAGVRARWDALGEDWFRTHNHHGDPERFDSSSGRFMVDWTSRGLAFEVRFDDFTGTSDGKSAATERLIVACDGMARAATVKCGEAPESAWMAVLPGRDAENRLREAAARPHLIPWK